MPSAAARSRRSTAAWPRSPAATCGSRSCTTRPPRRTLQGEPPGIFTFLGSGRFAEPIARHRPDLVLHGHAHAGTVEGTIEGVPVFNVSVPVIKRDFWLFEHAGAARAEREGLRLRTA